MTDDDWTANSRAVNALLEHIGHLRRTLSTIEEASSEPLIKMQARHALQHTLRIGGTQQTQE